MAVPKIVKVACPSCGKDVPALLTGDSEIKVCCPACAHTFSVKVRGKAINMAAAPAREEPQRKMTVRPGGGFTPTWTVAAAPSSAVLRVKMHRMLLPASTHTFPLDDLHSHVIGRADNDAPSDISITGDPSISRRCASIEHIDGRYILSVLKTKNPISINGRELKTGESIELRYGDRIKMGKTTMEFADK